MISLNDIIAIKVLVFIFALFIVFKLFQSYFLDKFRNSLFLIRDELFNIALNNKKGFNLKSKEYCFIRDLLNVTLRFAHRYNVKTLIISSISLRLRGLKFNGERFRKDIYKIASKFDKKTNQQILEVIRNYEIVILKYLLWSSIFYKTIFLVKAVQMVTLKISVNKRNLINSSYISDVEYSAEKLCRI